MSLNQPIGVSKVDSTKIGEKVQSLAMVYRSSPELLCTQKERGQWPPLWRYSDMLLTVILRFFDKFVGRLQFEQ